MQFYFRIFSLVLPLITVIISPIISASSIQSISTRGYVRVGDPLIAGVIVGNATASSKVVIKARGPSMPINGTLSDPSLELYAMVDGAWQVIDSNNDWQQHPTAGQIPLRHQPHFESEAALVYDLFPGTYTVVVRGYNNTQGTGIVEVYELQDGDLKSISTRGYVDDNNKLIAGVILKDNEGKATVKARGPSMPINGTLSDPRLILYQMNNNSPSIVDSNDDWQTHSSASLIPKKHQPKFASEAALLYNFASGPYTVVVGGASNDAGTAIVEVYEVEETTPPDQPFVLAPFTSALNVAPGSTQTSNSIAVNGLTSNTQAIISGGLGNLVINGQDTGSHTSTVKNGDTIAIRATAPTSGRLDLTLTLGTQDITWNVTTVHIQQPAIISGTAAGSTPVECSVNEAGGAQCTLAISAPPGTSGMTPQLSIHYGQGNNGLLGLGFSLGGLSVISRCAATLDQEENMTGIPFSDPVDFDDNDRFCLDGERLMAEPSIYGQDGTVYRTEQESWQKIVSYGTAASGPEKFKVSTKSGLIMEYGFTADSRIEAQGKEDVLIWALNKVTDTVGNYYTVSYLENNANGEYYPLQIDYTGNDVAWLSPYASVRFEYTARPDIVPTFIGGSMIKITQRLQRIDTRIGSDIYRSYSLVYEQSELTQQSRLVNVQECGIGGVCFEPTSFNWIQSSITDFINSGLWGPSFSSNVIQGDYNGDGKTDIAGYNGTHSKWHILLSSGTGFINGGLWGPSFSSNVIQGDYNGDGKTDIAGYNGTHSKWHILLNNEDSSLFLSNIKVGLEQKTIMFAYKPLTDDSVYTKGDGAIYPEMDFIGPLYVVSSISTDDGIGGQRTLDYFYEGAKVHLQGRGFRGFSKLTLTDRESGIQNITFYDRDYRALSTKVRRTETRLANGRLIADTDNIIEVMIQGYGVHFSRIKKNISREYEVDGSPIKSTVTENLYDNYGNPTQVKTTVYEGLETTGSAKYLEITDNTYVNNIEKWHLGRLTYMQVSKNIAGQGISTRSSAWEYDSISGLITKEIKEPGHSLCLEKFYHYDIYGNTIQSNERPCNVVSKTRGQQNEYDSKGRFAIRSSNALNHSENKEYDVFGNLTALTGPNDLTTRWTYDGFGRKILETRADGTWTQNNYLKHDNNSPCSYLASYYVQNQTSGGNVNYQCFDKLDREIRQATFGFDGELIFTDTEYNAKGEVVRKSDPYFSTETPQWTTVQYDKISRPLKETAPDGSANTVFYQGLTTVVTNPLGQKNTQIQDVQGNTIQSIDNLGNSVVTLFDNFNNPIQISAYRSGMLLMTPTTIEYDKLGNKTRMNDPDTGITSYQYNAFGELISQTDAKGQTLTNEYDLLSRLIKRSEPEGISIWEYDTAPKSIGKLTKVIGVNNYTETFRYDAFGREDENTININNQKFVTTTQFDQYGRTHAVVYPTGFAVRNFHNDYGYLSEVRDAKTNRSFWRADNMNARGQLEKATLGNGLETQKTYDSLTGFIKTIRTGTPANAQGIQNLSFEFDAIGNLTERRKGILSERFTYDDLNRLTRSTLSTGQSTDQTYDYLGNITSKSDVGMYLYGTKPHAVTKAGNISYTYDAVGNRISASHGESIEYTSFNKPSKIIKGSTTLEFQYSPNYNRYRQRVTENGQTKDILYVGLYEQETVNGVTQGKHTIVAGKENVAVYITDSNTQKTHYLHKDHLDSIDVITDEFGNIVDNLSFDAWGRRRDASDWHNLSETEILAMAKNLDWRHGFTNHEHLDSVELIHMNGLSLDDS